MQSASNPDLVPASAHFAIPDVVDAHNLKRRILACLRDRVPNLERIHVTVFGSTAALRGEVRSLPDKYRCLECCRHVPGVIRVVDELIVADANVKYRTSGEKP